MSFWVAGALLTSTVYTTVEAKKSQKKGRKKADADAVAARKAEEFADQEGKGIGELGKISLEVDDENITDEELSLRQGSTVRI
jgi:hypothetical protein